MLSQRNRPAGGAAPQTGKGPATCTRSCNQRQHQHQHQHRRPRSLVLPSPSPRPPPRPSRCADSARAFTKSISPPCLRSLSLTIANSQSRDKQQSSRRGPSTAPALPPRRLALSPSPSPFSSATGAFCSIKHLLTRSPTHARSSVSRALRFLGVVSCPPVPAVDHLTSPEVPTSAFISRPLLRPSDG